MKQINLAITEKENRWTTPINVGQIVNVGLPNGDSYERIWVKVVLKENDTYVGQFNSRPLNTNYKFGDQFLFGQENIFAVWKQTPWEAV